MFQITNTTKQYGNQNEIKTHNQKTLPAFVSFGASTTTGAETCNQISVEI
jgi:hypothetical protein